MAILREKCVPARIIFHRDFDSALDEFLRVVLTRRPARSLESLLFVHITSWFYFNCYRLAQFINGLGLKVTNMHQERRTENERDRKGELPLRVCACESWCARSTLWGGCPEKISNYQRAYATQHARHTTQTNESNCRRLSGSAHSTSVLFDLGNVLGTGGDPLLAFFAPLWRRSISILHGTTVRQCETVIGIVSEQRRGVGQKTVVSLPVLMGWTLMASSPNKCAIIWAGKNTGENGLSYISEHERVWYILFSFVLTGLLRFLLVYESFILFLAVLYSVWWVL